MTADIVLSSNLLATCRQEHAASDSKFMLLSLCCNF